MTDKTEQTTETEKPATAKKTEQHVPKVQHDNCSPVVQSIAQSLYESYISNSGGLAHDGKKCPAWKDLGNPVRSHWCAAALNSLVRVSQLSASDLDLERRAAG